ncbi:VOC family protein [Ideonella azotifigens]|uniref:VOC family protein n=1 Tax=Ideonella azotifigens TaxID=513160 RepID=A0ABN1KG34_9BURK|nr:VOC family protein [Ideonella azotifigens]MCD2340449.1 VOC family protein [Ideonella azotifigens]
MPEPSVQPYLFFAGNCEEALVFYGKTLNAKLQMMMRYSDSPEPPPMPLPEGFKNKVMHASFHIGDSLIMASDSCEPGAHFAGFTLSFNARTETEAQRVFAALSEGGSVKMPLGKTFWAPCFGMLTDRFGVGWMVGVPGEQG